MYKRIFLTIFLALVSVFVLFRTSFAQSTGAGNSTSGSSGASGAGVGKDMMPIYPNPGGNPPFAGENQYYSVVFRGNGEAVVTLRVALTNTKEDGSTLSEVSLRVPKVDPKDLSVYQIIGQGYCIRYAPIDTQDQKIGVSPIRNCLEYNEPDYYNTYYSGSKFQKAIFDYSGDTLKITLPKPIAPQKSGSFFVYYRAFGYAKKDIFGAYNFQFETLKVNEQINQLNVGISTDADQFLKNAQGKVQYRFEDTQNAMKAAPSVAMGAVSNSMMDRFVSQIGQGTIVKSASNLAALESYKVDGTFAGSRIKLYGREILIGVGVFLLFILIAVLVVRAIAKGFRSKGEEKKENAASSNDGAKNFLIALGLSFISSVVSAGYTVLVFFIGNSMNNVVDYQFQAIVMILLVVISFAIYMLLIVGPSIYMGVKKGLGWGLGTFVMTIVWLILFAIVSVLVIYMIGYQRSYPPGPQPLMY